MKKSHRNVRSEADKIMAHFRALPDRLFTPDEIRERMHLPEIKIIGIRRAITDLTKKGLLRKTDIMGVATSGVTCHKWTLTKKDLTLF